MKKFFQVWACLLFMIPQLLHAQDLKPFENKKGLHGFKDASGKTVIQAKFRHVDNFSEGRALARDTKGKTGYIDTDGKVAIPFKYYNGTKFNEGVGAVIELGKDAFKWVIIDKGGRQAIPQKFDGVKDYSEGYICVNTCGELVLFKGAGITKGGKWGIIDTKGNVIVPIIYDAIFNYSEGLAPVNEGGKGLLGVGGKWGFVNTRGEVVIEPQFDLVLSSFEDGRAKVSIEKREFYIDKTGKEIQ